MIRMAIAMLTDRQTYTQMDARRQHISLNSTEAVFLIVTAFPALIASSWLPYKDFAKKSRGNRTCRTRMLRGNGSNGI